MTKRVEIEAETVLEALELADATLRGANMNRGVVERKIGDAIASLRDLLKVQEV